MLFPTSDSAEGASSNVSLSHMGHFRVSMASDAIPAIDFHVAAAGQKNPSVRVGRAETGELVADDICNGER